MSPCLDEFYNSMLALLPSFDDKKAFLNWANSEMIQWNGILFYLLYGENPNVEGRICFFNSSTFEVEIVEKFSIPANPCKVSIGNDKIFLIDGIDEVFETCNYETKKLTKGPDSPKWRANATVAYYKNKLYYISGLWSNCVNILINGFKQVFEIFNYETEQLTKGPDPPEWRGRATVTYYKDKLYYIGGWDSNEEPTSCVNILVNETWQRGPDFPIDISFASQVICNDKLYIISENAVFQLSDDEREWTEVGKMKGDRWEPAVASLNGKIYITGGEYNGTVYNSCLRFDPSQPFARRFTSIANMNYERLLHSLVVANGKLYAIGGYQAYGPSTFCKSVEEYDPNANSWRIVSEIE